MSKPSPPTLAALAAGVGVLMLAAGCGSSSTAATTGAPSPKPAASSSSGRPVPGPAASERKTPPAAPAAAPVELDVEAVATRYLAARENAISYRHPSARDWLSAVQPVMTLAGWQRLSTSLGDSGGFPAATSRQRQWSVRAAVACRHNPDAAVASSTQGPSRHLALQRIPAPCSSVDAQGRRAVARRHRRDRPSRVMHPVTTSLASRYAKPHPSMAVDRRASPQLQRTCLRPTRGRTQ